MPCSPSFLLLTRLLVELSRFPLLLPAETSRKPLAGDSLTPRVRTKTHTNSPFAAPSRLMPKLSRGGLRCRRGAGGSRCTGCAGGRRGSGSAGSCGGARGAGRGGSSCFCSGRDFGFSEHVVALGAGGHAFLDLDFLTARRAIRIGGIQIGLAERAGLHDHSTHALDGLTALGALVRATLCTSRTKTHMILRFRSRSACVFLSPHANPFLCQAPCRGNRAYDQINRTEATVRLPAASSPSRQRAFYAAV